MLDILEVYKAQKEKGQDWMLPDASVPSGGEDIWELALNCTRFEVSERPRQWNDIANQVGLISDSNPSASANYWRGHSHE